jgi:hypothetical protein
MGRDYQAAKDSQLIGEVIAKYCDTGDAVAGTLPLCKFGQGDFVREVNP